MHQATQLTRKTEPAVSLPQLLHELRMVLGDEGLLTDDADLLAYDGDAFPAARQTPAAVALPRSTEQAAAIVRLCIRHGIPFVPRGAGTGLSGGATPLPNSVVISLARMSCILEVDAENRVAHVEAGCTNQAISDAAASHGLHYAPDPSSQLVCTVGGNIAENAGGPHTLKHGVTVNHVLGVRLVTSLGEIIEIGGPREPDEPLDLLGLIVGSEGTLGIVTEAWLRLVPVPEAVRTLLGVFPTVSDATECVVEIMARGVVPCALEMIDRTILVAIEDAFHLGLPRDAEAVLTVEVDGTEESVREEAEIVREVFASHRAAEVRVASDPAERERLWIARKKGVGTTGRLARSIITQDGAIPRSKLPEVLAAVRQLAAEHNIRVCNIFHAGDGNLHPCVLYDHTDAEEAERVHAFNEAVLALCVREGGTITGEHGVGLEKREAMRLMFTDADLSLMERVRKAFDPAGLCNPGKLIPK